MAFLIFLGLLVGGAAFIVGVSYLMRPTGKMVPLVFLGTPLSYTEQVMWLGALKSAGIPAHVENPRPSTAAGVYPSALAAASPIGYDTEVWVHEEDSGGGAGGPRLRSTGAPDEAGAVREAPPANTIQVLTLDP